MLPPSTTMSEEATYASLYPFYAEICALSALNKKTGFGIEVKSGIGGHAVFYLNGVCRKPDSAYPILVFCDEAPGKSDVDGVGISVNAHYSNANWVAIEGRDFFFDGGMEPGTPLTRESYEATLKAAKARAIYEGVTFHPEAYGDIPPGSQERDLKYEVSIGTDYAIAFGRNRYCSRVPMSRSEISAMIAYLNALNEPYRTGKADFDWSLFSDNCAEVNHNTLAAVNIWEAWPAGRPLLISIFDFPVPKNEFVNLVRRTNDMPIDDLETLYRDASARRLLLEEGRLPTEPGAIIDLGRVIADNDVYDTDSRIIFFDAPIFGRYEGRFDSILTEKRYSDLRANLAYFSTLYDGIRRARQPLDVYLTRIGRAPEERENFSRFYKKYYAYIDKEAGDIAKKIAQLDKPTRYAKAL